MDADDRAATTTGHDADVALGVRICRSWVLLLGIVSFEYDDLTLVERMPGAAAMFQRVVGAIFAHRHRRLVAMYGRSATPATPT